MKRKLNIKWKITPSILLVYQTIYITTKKANSVKSTQPIAPEKPQLSSTKPNITLVGLDIKMTVHTTPPPTQTQYQQYLSCY